MLYDDMPNFDIPSMNRGGPGYGSHGSLFDAQAKSYAAFRPNYPAALYKKLFEFCGTDLGGELAVDVGTGSGQVASYLAGHFDRVVGTDPSPSQLSHAVQLANVEYVVAPGEDMPDIQAGSVDLCTVAQAFHWMDARRFYSEMQRVLKPTGVLAIWGYSLNQFPPEHAAGNAAMQRWYSWLGPYWDPKRELIERHYAGLEPMESEFKVVERADLEMVLTMTLDDLVGYLSTWSSYQTFVKANPGAEDPLIGFRQELQQALLEGGADLGCLQVQWPVFMLLCKQPVPLGEAVTRSPVS